MGLGRRVGSPRLVRRQHRARPSRSGSSSVQRAGPCRGGLRAIRGILGRHRRGRGGARRFPEPHPSAGRADGRGTVYIARADPRGAADRRSRAHELDRHDDARAAAAAIARQAPDARPCVSPASRPQRDHADRDPLRGGHTAVAARPHLLPRRPRGDADAGDCFSRGQHAGDRRYAAVASRAAALGGVHSADWRLVAVPQRTGRVWPRSRSGDCDGARVHELRAVAARSAAHGRRAPAVAGVQPSGHEFHPAPRRGDNPSRAGEPVPVDDSPAPADRLPDLRRVLRAAVWRSGGCRTDPRHLLLRAAGGRAHPGHPPVLHGDEQRMAAGSAGGRGPRSHTRGRGAARRTATHGRQPAMYGSRT